MVGLATQELTIEFVTRLTFLLQLLFGFHPSIVLLLGFQPQSLTFVELSLSTFAALTFLFVTLLAYASRPVLTATLLSKQIAAIDLLLVLVGEFVVTFANLPAPASLGLRTLH